MVEELRMIALASFMVEELRMIAKETNEGVCENICRQQLENKFTTSSASIPKLVPTPISRPRPRPGSRLAVMF